MFLAHYLKMHPCKYCLIYNFKQKKIVDFLLGHNCAKYFVADLLCYELSVPRTRVVIRQTYWPNLVCCVENSLAWNSHTGWAYWLKHWKYERGELADQEAGEEDDGGAGQEDTLHPCWGGEAVSDLQVILEFNFDVWTFSQGQCDKVGCYGQKHLQRVPPRCVQHDGRHPDGQDLQVLWHLEQRADHEGGVDPRAEYLSQRWFPTKMTFRDSDGQAAWTSI